MRTKEANERSKAEQEYLKHSQHLYQNPGETMATMLFQSRLEVWRTTPPPVDDAVARTALSAVAWGRTPHGICSSISNGIGSGKAGTSHPPFKRSSSHLEEDVMPERSNLFESQWSNQWLTQKRVN